MIYNLYYSFWWMQILVTNSFRRCNLMKLLKKAAVLAVVFALLLSAFSFSDVTPVKAEEDIALGKVVFDGDSTYDWSHFYSIDSKSATLTDADLNISVIDTNGKIVPTWAYTIEIAVTFWDDATDSDARIVQTSPYGIAAIPGGSEGFCEYVATVKAVKDKGYTGEIEGTFHIMDKYCLDWICADTRFEGAKKDGWRMFDRFWIDADKIKAPVLTGNDGSVLEEGKDYKIEYYTRKEADLDSFETDRNEIAEGVEKLDALPDKAGGYIVKIKGIKPYYGETTLLLDVEEPAVSAGVTAKKVKAAKKAFTLTWKKQSDAKVNGYEIEYSTDQNFEKAVKTVKVKGNDVTSKKIKKLKAKKTYYVRIRSYTKIDGVIVYSDWSDTVKVKTK